MVDVFISYKKERRAHARRLAAVLEAYGFDVWWDYGLLVDAGDYDAQIEAKLLAAKAVIVLWCSGSRASSFVKDEARRARDANKLLPALIEAGVEPPLGFGVAEMAFLLGWSGDPEAEGVLRLVAGLERLAQRPRQRRPNTIDTLKEAAPLPAVTPMAVVETADSNAPPFSPIGAAKTAGPSFDDLKAIWAGLKTRGTAQRVAEFYEEFAKHTALRFEVEHHIEEMEAARKAEEDRLAKHRRAAEAAKAGAPVAERAFPIELPGVAGWPTPQMIALPPGRFLMGAPASEESSGDAERPQHEVRIDYAFALGQHTVTFAEWDAALAAGAKLEKPGDFGWGRANRPVINVNWEDAQAYLAWLNDKTALTGRPDAYRLPSEAEWEYSCRAGTTTPFNFGTSISTAQANYNGNYTYGKGSKGEYRQETMPVGSFSANPFGLHEMHGNVWEWCQDCLNNNYAGAPDDGSAWTAGDCSRRVLRGGSWLDVPNWLRSAFRNWDDPTDRNFDRGFRLARTLFTP